MKKIKEKLKGMLNKNASPLEKFKSKLSKSEIIDIESAMTEIELRDR